MKALLWLSEGFHMDQREVLVAILLPVNNITGSLFLIVKVRRFSNCSTIQGTLVVLVD
jgi:hypothetical protein